MCRADAFVSSESFVGGICRLDGNFVRDYQAVCGAPQR
jgi:hypothetical protein